MIDARKIVTKNLDWSCFRACVYFFDPLLSPSDVNCMVRCS